MKIVGVVGSLRKQSLNRALMAEVKTELPSGVELDVAEIRDLPLYDGDLDSDAMRPQSVTRFIDAIAAADGVLIATPEYNYGIPGPLKNAIDWASRPAYASVFAGKKTALMSASMSPIGGARAQGQLKQVLLGVVAVVYPYPEVLVTSAGSKFADGRLTDDETRARLRKFLAGFAGWVREATQRSA